MLRKLANHSECARRELLRSESQIPGGCGGSWRRRELHGAAPLQDGPGGAQRVEGDWTRGPGPRPQVEPLQRQHAGQR